MPAPAPTDRPAGDPYVIVKLRRSHARYRWPRYSRGIGRHLHWGRFVLTVETFRWPR